MAPQTIAALCRDLRDLERRDIQRRLRANLRRPLPAVRAAVKARCLAVLPKRGGLNRWAAKAKVDFEIVYVGAGAGVRLVVHRRSMRGESDLKALDRGRVRHPSWGRRGRGQWHTQRVPPKVYSGPLTEVTRWRRAAAVAVDEAVERVGRG